MRILLLRPGARSVALTLRKRWLVAAGALVLAVTGWKLSARGTAALGSSVLPPSEDPKERHRLLTFSRKLAQLEQQLARLGARPATAVGGRGGPELPVTLDSLGQEADLLLERVRALSNHREALSSQLRRRYSLDLPLANLPLGLPLRGSFDYTSGFGLRSDPWTGASTPHHGIDLAADEGTAIIANAPGRVVTCEQRSGYGLLLELDHGGGLTTRYGHLSACRVSGGDRVVRDQEIASVGNSGRSTGPHLHYEVLIKGRAIDPAPLVWLSSVSPS